MMNIGFTKMHGLGNDFVVIDNMNGRIKLSKEQIVFLCDRHKGVGADGLILVEKSDKVDSAGSPQADCFMNYYNADGTQAEMCGNGVRCITKFFKEEILPKSDKQHNFKIETRAGIKNVDCLDNGIFSVNMGKPIFSHADFPENSINLEGLSLDFVSVGNPHAVSFVRELEKYDLSSLGPKIENDKSFPNKINFELVEKVSADVFNVKVWERGCGATLACGTGACAVYAVVRKDKETPRDITICLPGGKLLMSENEKGDIIMRGEAVSVFSSMIEVK